MSLVDEILIKVPREAHRDREWVDSEGLHWLWCEDAWRVWVGRPDYTGWVSGHGNSESHYWKPMDEDPPERRGPYTAALYLRLMGRSW